MMDDDQVVTAASRPWTTSIEFTVTDVRPSLWWVCFGLIHPDLIHDATWDGTDW